MKEIINEFFIIFLYNLKKNLIKGLEIFENFKNFKIGNIWNIFGRYGKYYVMVLIN